MNKWIVSVMSIAAIIISIIAIANVNPTQNINFDYMGAIVGVLSFLVTLLIGYQIYTVINVKDELKELKNARADMLNEIEIRSKALKDGMNKDVRSLLPLLISIDMNDPKEIISTAMRTHQKSEEDTLSKNFADEMAANFLNKVACYDESKRNVFVNELSQLIDKNIVASYYSHFLDKKDEDKTSVKGAEKVLVMLINCYNER